MYRDIKPEEIRVNKTLGYAYFYDPIHPLASGGIVYFHRHVASIKEGFWVRGFIVHHIDEDKLNNSPDNLQILESRSAHTSLHNNFDHKTKECSFCKKDIIVTYQRRDSYENIFCNNQCQGNFRQKIQWPEIDDLLNMLRSSNFKKIGEMLGVSDNAVRKRLLKYGVDAKKIIGRGEK